MFGRLEALLRPSLSGTNQTSKHFTRERALVVPVVVGLILTMVTEGTRLGYERLVEKFWSAAKLVGISLLRDLPVRGSAFCVARMNLGWEFFRTLVHETAAKFEKRFGPDCWWKGRQVFAVDGTKLVLPRAKALDETFGRPKGAGRPMVAVLTLFNVMSRVTKAVAFGRYESGERVLIHDLLDEVPERSVLLLDRGYPSLPLFSELCRRGIDFIARVPKSGTFSAVMSFVATKRRHSRITLISTRRRPGIPSSLPVRIVRKRGGDEDMLLVTSLSASVASLNELVKLYRHRWAIEGCFKVLKVDGFGTDSFHSLTPNGIKQEICARLLFLNLKQHLLAEAASRVGKPVAELAPKAAHSALAHAELILLVVLAPRRAHATLASTMLIVGRSKAEHRKRRSFPRVSHKPSLRWDRTGKTSRRGH